MKINKSKQLATVLTAIASILFSTSLAVFFESRIGNLAVAAIIIFAIVIYWLSVNIIKEDK